MTRREIEDGFLLLLFGSALESKDGEVGWTRGPSMSVAEEKK